MTCNESPFDRLVRISLGVLILALVFVGPKSLWGLLGLIPLVTGLTGFCPLYRLLGIDTCARDRRDRDDRGDRVASRWT